MIGKVFSDLTDSAARLEKLLGWRKAQIRNDVQVTGAHLDQIHVQLSLSPGEGGTGKLFVQLLLAKSGSARAGPCVEQQLGQLMGEVPLSPSHQAAGAWQRGFG